MSEGSALKETLGIGKQLWAGSGKTAGKDDHATAGDGIQLGYGHVVRPPWCRLAEVSTAEQV